MAKVLCVLYDDPVSGYPPSYARDDIPKIERYHDGQTTPTPSAIDFTPGELLGCVSGGLGLRVFLESGGHALVRNYIPSYKIVVDGGWNIADAVSRSYDVEGMQVGTVAAGRIGSAVLRRLKPFEVGLHYTDKHRLPKDVEDDLGVTFHDTV